MIRTSTLSNTLILIIVLTTTPLYAQSGLLTKGNIFAESLAGCSLGVAFNLTLLLTTQTSSLATHRIGIVQYCLTGSILAATIHSLIELSNLSAEMFYPHGITDKKIPMVYPETPGREY